MSDVVHRLSGRKIVAFVILGITVTGSAGFLHWIGAPVEIIKQVAWIIGLGGIFTIGGQSLVDTVGKYVEARKA